MKAYQYFHLPSGYEAKYSDNTSAELAICETVRQTIDGDTYYAYFATSTGEGVLLNSVRDPQGNQFIVGRYAKQSEFTGFPVSYCELIRDARLQRLEMPLIAMPLMAPPASVQLAPGIDMKQLAIAYEAALANKPLIISQSGVKGCVAFLKALCGLLPKAIMQRLGFVIGDATSTFSAQSLDPFGNATKLSIGLRMLPRALNDAEWGMDAVIIDGVGGRMKAGELGPLGQILSTCNGLDAASLNGFKINYAALIHDDGSVDEGAFKALGLKDRFLAEDFAAMKELVAIFDDIPVFLKPRIVAELADKTNNLLDLSSLSGDSLAGVVAMRSTSPEFAEATDASYRAFLGRNIELLDASARKDYAENLAASNDAFDDFLNDTVIELDERKRATRFEILHHALYFPPNDIDQDTFRARVAGVLGLVNIGDCYATLDYEQRTKSEFLFNSLPEGIELTDEQIDRYAILLYSAYLKNGDEEWKRMRLRGLEIRVKHVHVLPLLKVLSSIKERIEYYADLMMGDPSMMLSNLENFYFDEYRASIVDALSVEPMSSLVRFYDEHRGSSYAGMLGAVINALSSFPRFLESYDPQSRVDIEESKRLFESITPSNEELAKIVAYITQNLAEFDLESTIREFRMSFVKRCIVAMGGSDLLPQQKTSTEQARSTLAYETTEAVLRLGRDYGFASTIIVPYLMPGDELQDDAPIMPETVTPVYQEAPVNNQPIRQQPIYQQPSYQQPARQQPSYQQPQRQSSLLDTAKSSSKTIIRVTIKGQVSSGKSEPIDVLLSADVQAEVPPIDIYPILGHERRRAIATTPTMTLKKGLLTHGRYVATFKFKAPPMSAATTLSAEFSDPGSNEYFVIQ